MEIISIEDGCGSEGYGRSSGKRGICSRIYMGAGAPYTCILNTVVTLLLVLLFILVIFFFKDYLKAILYWVETQNPWLVFILFVFLFTVVSFPITIGYLLLIITSGYLFGIFRGLGTVLISANIGVAISHYTLKALSSRLPVNQIVKNETAKAMLRVISGPQAFKIVLFARLTPIPFGLQNTIFALSNVSGVNYHTASCLGLLPAQVINVYLGSTLRSMHDVLQESHITGYIVFAFQIMIGITLMVWVVQKARKELTLALMEAEIGREVLLTPSSSSASLS